MFEKLFCSKAVLRRHLKGPLPSSEPAIWRSWARRDWSRPSEDAEAWMASAGRTRVYVETSTRAQYDGTRRFYLACGYELAAELEDFYGPGDGKAMFLKVLS